MAEYQAWKRVVGTYFGEPDPAAEMFQKPWSDVAGFELVETMYHGFCIPEAGINGEIYFWFHPNLGVASGGIFIFRGKRDRLVEADYSNYCNFLPLPEDIRDCSFPNGISMKMVKPLDQWRITFEDPAEHVTLVLETAAIMPAAFRPSGGHFTQAVKNVGTLTLDGETYEIDGYSSRDRSWGDRRTEQRSDVPPPGWHVGVFGDDFAFHVMAFESADDDPFLAHRYPNLTGGGNLMWGYVWKDGELLGIKSCGKRTIRDAANYFPTEVSLSIVDERDHLHEIHGVIEGYVPLDVWPNIGTTWAMTRWTSAGRVGFGDTQEAMNPAFVKATKSAVHS